MRRPSAGSIGAAWSDERLVRECLDGNEHAWGLLIDRYKNLIYSIPLRHGATPDEAADIFQSVCITLYSELERVRSVASLTAWLISVTTRQTYRSRRRHVRQASRDEDATGSENLPDESQPAPERLEELEREQSVRRAIARLSPRCRKMVHLLFYEDPPTPYAEVARRLGLATGSIGFIRGRCLKRLEALLKDAGL
jgi:RNA polymerase sigma factor (sigma-70 family)